VIATLTFGATLLFSRERVVFATHRFLKIEYAGIFSFIRTHLL